ncbi:MAG: NUDIX domain-containing protein [Anaerolineae bacterium]|nr:NUDIX domain-containing protein [Anaerolineae bacterium]
MPPHRRLYHIVAALICRDDDVLLVRQQGPGDAQATWALPGGVAEPGALLTEALAREVREETGLTVRNPGRLAYVAQLDNAHEGYQSTTFTFAVGAWAGALRAGDPDGLVARARFMPRLEAVETLERLPWRVMHEPAVAYLRGDVAPGAMWFYRRDADGADQLVTLLAGGAPEEA